MPLNFPFQLTGKGYILWFDVGIFIYLCTPPDLERAHQCDVVSCFTDTISVIRILQAKYVIAGTGDIFDVVCYYNGCFSSLLYKTSFKPFIVWTFNLKLLRLCTIVIVIIWHYGCGGTPSMKPLVQPEQFPDLKGYKWRYYHYWINERLDKSV